MLLHSNNHCAATYHRRRLANSQRNSQYRRRKYQPCGSSQQCFLEPIPEEGADCSSTTTPCLLTLANRERARRGVPPLKAVPELNQLCYQHCLRMAGNRRVEHSVSSVPQLQDLLRAPVVGENVQTGVSVAHMHWECLHGGNNGNYNHTNAINRRNLLAPYFAEYGSAVVCVVERAADGQQQQRLYSCQLFRCAVPEEDPYDTAWLKIDGTDDDDDVTACSTQGSDEDDDASCSSGSTSPTATTAFQEQ